MVELLTHLVVSLFKKSTGGRAKTTPNGISGRIPLPISMMILIPAGLFIALGCLAIKHPDPDERMTGYAVIATGAGFVLIFLHFLTYRLFTSNHLLIADSLLMKERIIDLEQPFSLEDKGEGILVLRQEGKKIRISWNVKGHLDFSDVVERAYASPEEHPPFEEKRMRP